MSDYLLEKRVSFHELCEMLIDNNDTDHLLPNFKLVATVMIESALGRHYSNETSRKVRIGRELSRLLRSGNFWYVRNLPTVVATNPREFFGALYRRIMIKAYGKVHENCRPYVRRCEKRGRLTKTSTLISERSI